MANLTLNNKTLEKYFGLLKGLDNLSKKKLIIKLTESLEMKEEKVDLRSLFGAWEDDKDADEIIKEIRESKVEKSEDLGFE
ncbi:MAG: toxin-antitoxin system antidote component [Algoriphagus marincola HL-49]|uniref:Toxin-antitoxin system antidote component n=1 Tax=Algoriphagus marincola HL-49 TaxID=1305737 RepID=A0A0P8AQC2_9BACT|nr:MAG: toxin-antitoxin system antidote component [Algoriphagus marincola HL-49]